MPASFTGTATGIAWFEALVLLVIFAACVVPLGSYMAKIYSGEATGLSSLLGGLERLIYRIAGVTPARTMDWKTYALAALTASALGFLSLYLILVTQAWLPMNPAHLPGLPPELAFVRAASFVTNTPLGHDRDSLDTSAFSRMLGLTVQNFMSASVGISVFVAIVRSLSPRRAGAGIGNFWVDMVRTNLYVLLPISFIFIALVATSGVAEALDRGLSPSLTGHNTGAALTAIFSRESSQLVTTRQGTFLNANSAQSLSNLTPTFRLLAFLSVLLIPAALCQTLGRMAGDRRHGFILMGLVTVFGLPGALAIASPGWIVLPATLPGDATMLYGVIGLGIIAAGLAGRVTQRAPRYLRARVGAFEMTMATIAFGVLCLSGLAFALAAGHDMIPDALPVTSSAFYAALSIALLAGRFWVMIPTLAIAGAFAAQPVHAGAD